MRWSTLFKKQGGALGRDPMPEHEAVFVAIASRDAAAARNAMGVLVDMALADTVEAMRALEPPSTTGAVDLRTAGA